MQGYLLFYLDTKNIRRAPFYAVSIGNFVLLLVDVILNDYCYAYRSLITNATFHSVCLFVPYITHLKTTHNSPIYDEYETQ